MPSRAIAYRYPLLQVSLTETLESLKATLADRYTLERELGRGGMATVYLAQDLKHDRPVALKVLHPELAATLGPERFLREIRLAARLQHPHILSVHDSGETAGFLWFTMPFVEGESLRDRLVREHQLPVEEAMRLTREVAIALDFAHRHGVVHRDIKPENILLVDGQALVADFGIGRAVDAAESDTRLTQTGVVVGTPVYMSPEQSAGARDLDGRTDVYSLGVVLYEMLAGEPPFSGRTPQAVIAKRFMQPVLPLRALRPSVPEWVDQAVTMALAQVPADRFASAREFAQALVQTSSAEPSVTAPRTPVHRRSWARWRNPIVMLALCLIVAGGLLARARLGDGREAAAGPKMLAILPFENLGRPEDEYFADGLTEELTSRLGNLEGLGVISRTSALQYKGDRKPLKQIGRELGVEYVLEGSVRWDKTSDGRNRIRVTPQLIQVTDDRHVWSERFDADLADVFVVQGEIASHVTQALGVALGAGDPQKLTAQPTRNPDAYDHYLRAQAYLNRFRENRRDNLGAAIGLYERAVQSDPGFALAYARLGEAHTRMVWTGLDNSQARLAMARGAIDTALKLQPGLSDAYLALGRFHLWTKGDYAQAHSALARARALRPNDATLFESLADVERHQGQWDSAAAHLRRAADLDPLSVDVALAAATTLFVMRLYDEAEAYARRAQAIAPRAFRPYHLLSGIAVNRDGDTSRARRILGDGLATTGLENAAAIFVRRLYLVERDDSTLAAFERLPIDAFQGDTGYSMIWKAELCQLRGLAARSRAYSDSARIILERSIRERPADPYWESTRYQHLSSAYIGIGRSADAVKAAEHAVKVFPIRENAFEGILPLMHLASVYAQAGQRDAAVVQLEKLLAVPSGISRAALAVDPEWGPLRNYHRFQRLLQYDSSRDGSASQMN